jgi:D-sedoheptulose 7-phosphate isomerase
MKKIFAEQTKELKKALVGISSWHQQLEKVVVQLKEAFRAEKTVYVAGNGGSATLAQHLSDEMVGRYKANRRPYAVVALTADSAVLTCIANDFGYEEVFARQLEALGRPGDVFIGYSTSGNSENIIRATKKARDLGLTIVAFTGSTGKLKDLADYAVISPAKTTARIQELDLHAIHLMCEAFE